MKKQDVSTSVSAGKIRRIRRLHKSRKTKIGPRDFNTPNRMPVIRKPERTKKMSTPTNPPGTHTGESVVEDHRDDRDGSHAINVAAVPWMARTHLDLKGCPPDSRTPS